MKKKMLPRIFTSISYLYCKVIRMLNYVTIQHIQFLYKIKLYILDSLIFHFSYNINKHRAEKPWWWILVIFKGFVQYKPSRVYAQQFILYLMMKERIFVCSLFISRFICSLFLKETACCSISPSLKPEKLKEYKILKIPP